MELSELSKDKLQVLEDTAKAFLGIFNPAINYSDTFVKRMLAGGGGNSMLNNLWKNNAVIFQQRRISLQALGVIKEHGYTFESMPVKFYRNNAKGVENRKAVGKYIHEDHSPSCKYVMKAIYEYVKTNPSLLEFMEFLLNIQTIDYITVEQDDLRTLSDNNYSKSEKDLSDAKFRDSIINDTLIAV